MRCGWWLLIGSIAGGCGILDADQYELGASGGAAADGSGGTRAIRDASSSDVSASPSLTTEELASRLWSSADCRACRLAECGAQLERCAADATCVEAYSCDCSDPACQADCWRAAGLEERLATLTSTTVGEPWADLFQQCIVPTCQDVCNGNSWECAHEYGWSRRDYKQRFQLTTLQDGQPIPNVTAEACRDPETSDARLADDCNVPLMDAPQISDENGIVTIEFPLPVGSIQLDTRAYVKFSGPTILTTRGYMNRPWVGSIGQTLPVAVLAVADPEATIVHGFVLDCHTTPHIENSNVTFEWIETAYKIGPGNFVDAAAWKNVPLSLAPGRIARFRVLHGDEEVVSEFSFPTFAGENVSLTLWPEESQ